MFVLISLFIYYRVLTLLVGEGGSFSKSSLGEIKFLYVSVFLACFILFMYFFSFLGLLPFSRIDRIVIKWR